MWNVAVVSEYCNVSRDWCVGMRWSRCQWSLQVHSNHWILRLQVAQCQRCILQVWSQDAKKASLYTWVCLWSSLCLLSAYNLGHSSLYMSIALNVCLKPAIVLQQRHRHCLLAYFHHFFLFGFMLFYITLSVLYGCVAGFVKSCLSEWHWWGTVADGIEYINRVVDCWAWWSSWSAGDMAVQCNDMCDDMLQVHSSRRLTICVSSAPMFSTFVDMFPPQRGTYAVPSVAVSVSCCSLCLHLSLCVCVSLCVCPLWHMLYCDDGERCVF